jgi:hypothetical protein
MPKGRVVFISHGDDVIFDEAARAFPSLQEPDVEAWLRALIIGQRFTVYFKGYNPEVQAPTEPPRPRRAELLLNYILPKVRREEILGDLQEDYDTTWLPKFGPRQARRLYWWHAIRSIAPMLWTAVKKWGIITFIIGAAHWLRDRLG